MKKKIAIIGCGNIGYRHLQALTRITNLIDLWVVENSFKRIKKVKLLMKKKKSIKNNIILSNKINTLPKDLYLLIIATNSKERLKVLKKIVKHSKIKFIIFEKILFPKVHNYSLASKILKRYKIKSWVHTPKQNFPFFKFIINKLKKEKEFKIIIKGPEKNIGCNSIHYLSIFKKIINFSKFSVDISGLDKKIVKSKRRGYIEFNGNITFSTLDQKKFLFIDCPSGKKRNYFSTEVFFKNMKIIYNELSGNCKILNFEKRKLIKEKRFKIPYVSDSTQEYVIQVIRSGNCKLPQFYESAMLHKKLITNLQYHLNKNSKKTYRLCPIT